MQVADLVYLFSRIDLNIEVFKNGRIVSMIKQAEIPEVDPTFLRPLTI